MKIRAFNERDRTLVIELWKACGLIRPWNDPDKDIDRKMSFQPELFFVGVAESKIVASAMAGYDGHRGSVYYLAVNPEFRGGGFGAELMQYIETELVQLGCPKLNILVRQDNQRVLSFYKKIGYNVDDVFSVGKRVVTDV